MKTQEQIIERVKANRTRNLHPLEMLFGPGFENEVLISHLSYNNLVHVVDADKLAKITADEWSDETSEDSVLAAMKDYMEFALEKAYDHRGLSANRSINKIGAYLWMLDNQEVEQAFEAAEYTNYGVPKLMVVAEAYDIPVPEYMQEALGNMAQGNPCEPGCDMGCGI